jgi:iron(III) transport system substrate-binding protein
MIRRRTLLESALLARLFSQKLLANPRLYPKITAYVALDREFSDPLLDQFTKETHLEVRAKFDVESTKTIGLVNSIRSESARPRADVFWNNEIIHTIRLKKAGLLEEYTPTSADSFPSQFRDPDGRWSGFAARARVLIINTKIVSEIDQPISINDLTLPQWKHKIAIAKPFFGTTATHAASLYATMGFEKADKFFADLHRNQVQVLGGNKPVAEAVAAGRIAIGLTDTDDALVLKAQGHPVKLIYPDRNADQSGTLFIPNTLAMIKNSPNPEGAQRLLDWLYRPEVETLLANGPSGQIPLSPKARNSPKWDDLNSVKPMKVDFEKAAELFDDVMKRLSGLFQK